MRDLTSIDQFLARSHLWVSLLTTRRCGVGKLLAGSQRLPKNRYQRFEWPPGGWSTAISGSMNTR